MKNKITKIFATIGPQSLNENVLTSFKNRGVDYIRINLSHTPIEDIETTLRQMQTAGIEMVIDTEGSQVRTGDLGGTLSFKEGEEVKIFNLPIKSNNKQFYIRPAEFLQFVTPGALISVDFDSLLLKVTNIDTIDVGYIKAVVLIGGTIGNNKAVHSDAIAKLPPFSKKDLSAIELAKKYKIRYFTLSFIDNAQEVIRFKKIYPKAVAFSKIETKEGVLNFDQIFEESDGILIDRGDLSREVPLELIPFLQKAIVKKGIVGKKPVFIATNILENMCDNLKPMRSEVSDIVNSILEGVSGFVLTKETAVGKYPIETVNVLKGIISQTEFSGSSIQKNLTDILGQKTTGSLIEPHGGALVSRYRVMEFGKSDLKLLKKLYMDDEILMDVEQIAFGAYSPLTGFMDSAQLTSVLDKMRLISGLPWTMPIILTAGKKEVTGLKNREVISLVRKADKHIYATLTVSEIKKIDKEQLCTKWFGTDDKNHPGVARIIAGGDYLVAGEINLLMRRPSPFKEYELTPAQTRKIFSEKDWVKVVGFHSRNPIHRSHEYIQMEALNSIPADGLFIHPVVGKKKKGDFDAQVIIKVYELMMKKFYPKNKVVLAVYPTYSRYAGPREAIFTAICRKNYGCSHFIVGRDHTGVSNYYAPLASQEIFSKFPDLGIIPVFFDKVYYSTRLRKYMVEGSVEENEENKASISGTQVRELFMGGKRPPRWLMRPQIADEILKLRRSFKKRGRSIFVQ